MKKKLVQVLIAGATPAEALQNCTTSFVNGDEVHAVCRSDAGLNRQIQAIAYCRLPTSSGNRDTVIGGNWISYAGQVSVADCGAGRYAYRKSIQGR